MPDPAAFHSVDRATSTRRRFLLGGAAAVAAAPVLGMALGGSAGASTPLFRPRHDELTPRDVLHLLHQGNRRWVSGRLRHPHQSVERREEVAPRQHPLATVFSCIDSRVPPEIVFDRGVGDLYVVRTAAQTNDGLVQGAVEYGSEEARTPLVVVLGHQRCGAVTAAVEALNHGSEVPEHLADVVEALKPAYRAAKHLPGDQIENTILAQIRLTVRHLRHDRLLEQRIREHRVEAVGAYYSLDTGRVEFMVR